MTPLPATVSALLRSRRVHVVQMHEVDALVARIDAKRRQHKSVDAELATLRLMRAAQLRAKAQQDRRMRG